MRMLIPAAAILTLAGLQGAVAQTVIERRAPDTVVVDRPASESKTVERRKTSDGCSSKTVSRTNEDGDKTTVHKERCD